LPLNLLFVTLDYYPGVFGGAERQARIQAEELVRRGHKVTVVCPRFAGTGSGAINGVRVVRLWPGPPWLRSPWVYGPWFFLWVLWHAGRFDIIHVHHGGAAGRLAVLAGFIVRRRVYYKVTTAPRKASRSTLERVFGLPPRDYRGLRMAARVQALTPQIRDELIAARVAPASIAVIPNAVDVTYFCPATTDEKAEVRHRLGLAEGSSTFMYAGRFADSKGIDVLLAAWRLLQPGDGANLVLVGARTDGPALDGSRAERGVVVRDWTPEIRDYYRAADAFVLPSRREGMSNAVLEAMACGLPSIVSPAGAADGLVRDGENGLVVPEGDPAQLARAMRRLLNDRDLMARLGATAAESASNYGVASVVSRIESVYRDIAAGREQR
jgi:glycosyltransferase involved in cell wall biosynthesis